MDRREIPYDTRHQGVPSGASKLISKHMVCSMQTMHLPCIRTSTISKLTEPSFHLSLFTQEYQIVRPKWFLRLWCIRRKLCTYLALKLTMSTNGPKQDPFDTHYPGVPLGVSKLISKHMVCSMQIMHLSCIKISTISKQIKPSFHLSLFTKVPTGASKIVS